MANGYGLYDMSGNVWEWVLDEWHDNYVDAPDEGEVPWGDVFPLNQSYDYPMSQRVVRGGGWFDNTSSLRVTIRNDAQLNTSIGGLGIRLSRMLP